MAKGVNKDEPEVKELPVTKENQAEKDVFVWRVYPKYKYVLRPEVHRNVEINGKIEHVAAPGHKVCFSKHQAYVRPEDYAAMKKNYRYGVDFISREDLEALEKSAPTRAERFPKNLLERPPILINPL